MPIDTSQSDPSSAAPGEDLLAPRQVADRGQSSGVIVLPIAGLALLAVAREAWLARPTHGSTEERKP